MQKTGSVIICLALLSSACQSSDEVSFNEDVRPILNENCVQCHGGINEYADLNLLFRKDATGAAKSGLSAIVPGSASESELIERITHEDAEKRMPPEGPSLSDSEIDVLKKWINDGAEWEEHWAYAPFRITEMPNPDENAWIKNNIDSFVLAKLSGTGIETKEQSTCSELLRRVSLDLTGLPPSYQEVTTMCQGDQDVNYELFVDQLLQSPNYGERWASLWLDLARYADSQGYEKDGLRSHWQYRDWVIKAFDQDMPFDQFTIEQIAGDLVPTPSDDQILATGFHRNTMTNTEGGTDDEEYRVQAVVDRVNTTFEIWQGTTMACAQCHGHPYDPFRAEEYYQSFAFFNNTKDYDQFDESPVLYQFAEEDSLQGSTLLAQHDSLELLLTKEFQKLDLESRMGEWKSRLLAAIDSAGVPPLFEDRKIPRDVVRIVQKSDSLIDLKDVDRLREHFASLAPELDDLRSELRDQYSALRSLSNSQTGVIRELDPQHRRTTRVLERGNFLTVGDMVEEKTPSSLHPYNSALPNNRLGFANWLVDQENALTARVIVNRFWEQLFGIGLVETLEDFGTQGFAPSHPDLLEWLAHEFVYEFDWSIKALLKEIVMSATYRQSSTSTEKEYRDDPKNRLLARGPRVRLTGEMIRDQALAVSGLLSKKKFGPGVMPVQPEGIWAAPYSGLKWETSDGVDQYRRALYTVWRRTAPYPSILSFDGVSREFCVSRRIQTNTPLQALVTLNDPAFIEAAKALAVRVVADSPSSDAQDFAATTFRLALMRDASSDELSYLSSIYQEALNENYLDQPARKASTTISDQELEALAVLGNVVLNLDAFLTK